MIPYFNDDGLHLLPVDAALVLDPDHGVERIYPEEVAVGSVQGVSDVTIQLKHVIVRRVDRNVLSLKGR